MEKKINKFIKDNNLINGTCDLNDVMHYVVDGDNCEIILRGQPTPDSIYTVLRSVLLKSKDGYVWDVSSRYKSDMIIISDSFDVMVEGDVTANKLHLLSKSKGHIIIEIENNEFVVGEYTKKLNDDRYYKLATNSTVLNVPNDIVGVFASSN